MSEIFKKSIKVLRRFYFKLNKNLNKRPDCEHDPDKVSSLIREKLLAEKPCMIARFGANELDCAVNYLSIKKQGNFLQYILGKTTEWWWDENMIDRLNNVAGFFPPEPEYLEKFAKLMIEDISYLDILASWRPQERFFKNELTAVEKIWILLLDPYWSKIPWTDALKNKKVLVVHPFDKSIREQYQKRKKLFNKEILPDFELKTLQAVQSAAQSKTDFNNWFGALDYMKSEIDKVDYDICLIGAGAYGFSLAAHVKRQGKKAVHVGGSLQLLFGIRGKRWENNYTDEHDYAELVNEHWIRPSENEKPKESHKMEDSCYW